MSTLVIKKGGDKLAGTMSWPDQKDAKLRDLKLKDGSLTFSAEREVLDNKDNSVARACGQQGSRMKPSKKRGGK
jgi:hypothetical protein